MFVAGNALRRGDRRGRPTALDFSNAQSKDTTETGLMISPALFAIGAVVGGGGFGATLTKAASDALTATFQTRSTENATLGTVVVNAELR